MAVNTLTITYTEIQQNLAREIGWPRDPATWGTDMNADFALYIDRAMRQFYRPPVLPGENKSHNWSFLFPRGEITLSEPFNDGTLGVASGVVTFTEAIPTWVVAGDPWVVVQNGQLNHYTIDTRDTDYQITLTDTTVTIASATEFTMYRYYYNMPDDFGGMYSNEFTYRHYERSISGTIPIVGERMLREKGREYGPYSYPTIASITTIVPTTTQSSRWRVSFWPLPREASVVEYLYVAIPPVLTAAAPYHYGGADHSETVMASVVDIAYQVIHDSQEKHGTFMERLRQSVLHDRRNFTSSFLGKSVKTYGNGERFRDMVNQFRSDHDSNDINLTFG